ncbi:hypothetical protein ACFRFQ_17830 [Rhodococcus sp. NPDC056743]|uniref:hypothetical protein n=1 Tax=Rhodococcus sp. NPDC056743 TaxID=3345934 RepID=UPI00366C4A22
MKRTFLAAIAAAALLTGCGTDSTPVAVNSESATIVPSTTVAATVEEVEALTSTANFPNNNDPVGDGLDKEARQKVQEDPEGSAKLAIETSKIVGEPATPVEAQTLAGIVCVGIKLNDLAEEWGAEEQEDIATQLGNEMGMSQSDTLRLISLAVKYHCPEVAN